MRCELANDRKLSPQPDSSQPRRRLHGRHAVSRHRGRAGPCLRFQHRQARVGNNHRGPATRRVGASGPDRLERPSFYRQRRRRLQGRQGTHVRARREDRQDRLGILHGAKDRGRYGTRTARREPAQRLDLEKRPRHTDYRRWALDVIHARSADRVALPPGWQSRTRFRHRRARGRNLYTYSVVVLDAKAGDYKHHFKLVLKDWHDWDVSNPPILIQTAGGKQLMVVAPKDGYLYGFDRTNNSQLYKVPVTQIENVAEAFEPGKSVHFCPGAVGGEEWNSPAY